MVEKDQFIVGLNQRYRMSKAKFTIDNMKDYDITDKIVKIIGDNE